jgi:glucokinase
VLSRFNHFRITYKGGSQGKEADISEGIYMRKPSKVMIVRDLQEELWHIVESRIDSQAVTTDSYERIMRLAIQRFVEEQAKSLSMAELADALDSLEQTVALFLKYLRSKGIAGDPIAVL